MPESKGRRVFAPPSLSKGRPAYSVRFRLNFGRMCSHYQALKEIERLKRYFRIRGIPESEIPADTWPGYLAPYIRRSHDQVEYNPEGRVGRFGLIPHWAKDTKIGRQTYNSRSETSASKPAFRDAWKWGHRAIIPAESFFEPCYETGKAVPWRIRRVDGAPLGIAGLWATWTSPEGEILESFTMLTVNADGHPLMQRFHKPEDEKRMVVIFDPADYDRWLDCPKDQMMSMMTQYPAKLLTAEAANTSKTDSGTSDSN